MSSCGCCAIECHTCHISKFTQSTLPTYGQTRGRTPNHGRFRSAVFVCEETYEIHEDCNNVVNNDNDDTIAIKDRFSGSSSASVFLGVLCFPSRANFIATVRCQARTFDCRTAVVVRMFTRRRAATTTTRVAVNLQTWPLFVIRAIISLVSFQKRAYFIVSTSTMYSMFDWGTFFFKIMLDWNVGSTMLGNLFLAASSIHFVLGRLCIFGTRYVCLEGATTTTSDDVASRVGGPPS